MCARVDDERAALGEPRLAARERVLVELGGRRVPVDVPAHGDPVPRELVPIGDDRDHEASSYADERQEVRGNLDGSLPGRFDGRTGG